MSSTQEVGGIFDEGSGPAHAMLRSPTVLISAIGLWGMNIFFFRFFGIDYVRVLKFDLLSEEEKYLSLRRRAPSDDYYQGNDDDYDIDDSNDTTTTITTTTTSSTVGITNNSTSTLPPIIGGTTKGSRSNSPVLGVDIHHHPQHAAAHARHIVHHHDGSAITNGLDTSNSPGGGTNDSILRPSSVVTTAATTPSTTTIPTISSSMHHRNKITWERLMILSVILMFFLHYTTYVYMVEWGGNFIGAVLAYYFAVFIFILLPFPLTTWLRKASVIVLQRTFELINPRCYCIWYPTDAKNGMVGPRPIPFVDVFYADAMCSLSKVFFDWGMLSVMLTYYPDPVPPDIHNILIPSLCAALPFLIRARQCLVMHTVGRIKNDPKRYEHLLNALKYSTSLFPICLSAYQKTISPDKAHELEFYLIILLIINASYALYWDIVMDWGMMHNPTAAVSTVCSSTTNANSGLYKQMPASSSNETNGHHHHPNRLSCCNLLLRPRLRFGICISAIILITDCVLRFSWTLRFKSSSLFPSDDHFVLCTQFLEVFRRALWNLLRVDWENLKQMKKQKQGSASPKTIKTTEMVDLLSSNNNIYRP